MIEISEDLYEGIERRDGALETEYVCDELMKAVDNGTPLPKGHGTIKDVSQIEIPMCEDRTYERWVQVAIDSVPTIIVEDKEQTDDKRED